MRKVMIGIPAYTGQIHLGTMRSMITDFLALKERGDDAMIFDEAGNAMIAHCRDMIVAHFLASDCSDLLFVDSDVMWEAGSLLRLLDAPVEFVSGIYPMRKDPEEYCVQWLPREELWADPGTGLLEVAGVPAGFMRLSRSMLERMVTEHPDSEFTDENAPHGKGWALFDNIHEGRAYWGEDFSFCKRWRDIGGQIWVDPEIKMGHIGNKTFSGSLGGWLKSR